jgi:flagellar biosynthesis protein FlhG
VIKSVALQADESDFRLVVNMVRSRSEAMAVFQRIDAVCRRFLNLHIWYAGHVLSDAAVGKAVRKREPFLLDSPRCDAAFCVKEIARRLDGHIAAPRGGGLLRRMFGWGKE